LLELVDLNVHQILAHEWHELHERIFLGCFASIRVFRGQSESKFAMARPHRQVARRVRSPDLLLWIFWWQLPHKSPRDFGGLAVVVMNEETVFQFVFHLNALHSRFRRNLIGLPNGRVRFQKRETVFEIHLESVLPLQVADAAQRDAFRGSEWNFQWINVFIVCLLAAIRRSQNAGGVKMRAWQWCQHFVISLLRVESVTGERSPEFRGWHSRRYTIISRHVSAGVPYPSG
jgi:hypothetical protein